MHRDFAAR